MMRVFLICLGLVVPTGAFAHLGHWLPAAGHDHIAIGIAIGVTVVAGLAAWGKSKEDRDDAEDADEEEA